MSTSIVIGSLRFLGFHLTRYLLDQGQTVIGFDINDEAIEYADEKEMYIGRNANFQYKALKDAFIPEDAHLFISIYDFMDINEQWQNPLEIMLNFKGAEHIRKTFFLPPDSEEADAFVKKVPASQCVYVENLFGPWMPDSSLYSRLEMETDVQKEGIYIGDLFPCMEELLKIKGNIYIYGHSGSLSEIIKEMPAKDITPFPVPRRTTMEEALADIQQVKKNSETVFPKNEK
ncbi:hypothetical protein [Bacillus sp. 1P06AnD]|uniref:hypothetical protein n=1 Tax=Bacillus sp. 1P06AnD TaxID=3132208 RepID=UPI0039A2FF00